MPPRFRVRRDPAFHDASRVLHLICTLDDVHLPAVPPLAVTIPEDYPASSPTCTTGQGKFAWAKVTLAWGRPIKGEPQILSLTWAYGEGGMDSLKFHPGTPCPTLPRPAGGRRAAVFYPLDTPHRAPRSFILFPLASHLDGSVSGSRSGVLGSYDLYRKLRAVVSDEHVVRDLFVFVPVSSDV
jgi:hypothetical protein